MRLRGIEENTRFLFDPEAIMPSQFFPPNNPQTSCRKLLAAMFSDAIYQLETTNYMEGIREVRRWNETVEWILSEAEDWGTFLFCCYHMGSEGDRVRKALGKRYSLVVRDVPRLNTHPHRVVIDKSPVSYPDATIKCFRKNRYYVVFADGSACWVLRRNCTDENTIWNVGEKGTLVVTWRASRSIAHYAQRERFLESSRLISGIETTAYAK